MGGGGEGGGCSGLGTPRWGPGAEQRCRRCTLHPNDSLAMEGPLSRVKSLKKSLRQSFRRIRKSRVSGKKRLNPGSPSSKVGAERGRLLATPIPLPACVRAGGS